MIADSKTIKIYLVPQRSERQITYTFSGEVITAEIDGAKDVFDFSVLPDGELDRGGGSEDEEEKRIETVLPVCPVASARREEGVLHLELLNWLGRDAPYESRFPEWVELPLPESAAKGKTPERMAVIPWRTKQEIEAAKQAAQAEAQEREGRRARIRDGLTTARTQEELRAVLHDMATEMGLLA